MTVTPKRLAPLLRWAGSKRKLVDLLISISPPSFERYVEPFAGSACLFFAMRPCRAILNDLNRELISTYRTIRHRPGAVAAAVHAIPVGASTYYSVRAQNPATLTTVMRAARFVYLNRYCFNGVYRTNRRGQFNVPRGSRTGRKLRPSRYAECASALKSVHLMSGDFERCLDLTTSGDFVYLDPPFTTGRPTYGEYGYRTFDQRDWSRFVDALRRIDQIGAKFLVSFAPVEAFLSCVTQWYTQRILVRRHIAGFAYARRRSYELLVANYPFRHLH